MATDNIGKRQYPVRSSVIVPNILPNITLVNGDIKDAMLSVLYDRLPGIVTPQEKITWEVDQLFTRTDTLDGAVSSTTQTTIVVDNPTRWLPGQLWMNKRTGEVMGVQEVNYSTSVVTVVRAITALNSSGGTAAAAMVDADTLLRISSYMGENNSRQITQTTIPAQVYNYCQIFRTDLALSDRQQKRKFLTDNEIPYLEKKASKEFLIDLDRAYLFGERARFTDSSNDDVTLMAGIRSVISTNVFNVGGTLFESQFDEFLIEQGLAKGSTNKLLVASTNLFLALTQIAKTRMRYNVDISSKRSVSLGVSVATYMAPNGGELAIVHDRNISDSMQGEGYGIDMREVKRRVFSGNGKTGEVSYYADTSDNDDMGRVSTLYADMGNTYGAEEFHFMLKNVDGGSSDLPNS